MEPPGQDVYHAESARVALITQADSEVGAATAQAFAQSGADLALTLKEEADDYFLDSLRSYGGRVVYFPSSRHPTNIEAAQLVRAIVGAFGRIDVLVINSDRRVEGQVNDEDVDEDAVDEQYAVNLGGAVALIKATVKVMTDGGRVVAVGASVADRVGTPGLADFAATQAAIAAFCRGAAHDLGPRGITINVVQVGAMEVENGRVLTKEILAAECDSNALKRLGRPSEVANAILFLAGPGATFITGSVLNVDGGYNA